MTKLCDLAESVKRAKFYLHDNFTSYFLYDVIYNVYEKICHVEEKEDIFENSEFTCFCKILRSYQFLQVRLIIIIE
jgi:hypothetical protein